MGYTTRDHYKFNLYKMGRLLEDANLLPNGRIFLLSQDFEKIPPFKLGEVLNTSRQHLRMVDVEKLRDESPLFRLRDVGNNRIELQQVVKDQDVKSLVQFDLGPFRWFGLINITETSWPMFKRDFLAYTTFKAGNYTALEVFHALPGGTERKYIYQRSLFPRWEEYFVPSAWQIFFRTDKFIKDPSSGIVTPIYKFKRRPVPK